MQAAASEIRLCTAETLAVTAAQMCRCRLQALRNTAVKICQQCRPLVPAGVMCLCRAEELEVEDLKERLNRLSGLFWSVLSVAGRAKAIEKEEVDEK